VWILTALLAGLFTAVASDNAEKGRQQALNEALRQRLALGPGSRGHRRPPVEGGVPVWAWADGHRIVRIVTEPQMDAVYAQMSDKMLWDYEISTGVMSDSDDPDEPAHPGWSIFVYLDAYNRVHALFAVEAWEIQEFVGFGPGSQIQEPIVRSRMFQFVQDHDLTHRFDESSLRGLWYERFLIEPGYPEIIAAVVDDNPAPLTALRQELERRAGPEEGERSVSSIKTQITLKAIGRYFLAFGDLYAIWQIFETRRREITQVKAFDVRSAAFFEYLGSTDWGWRLDDRFGLSVLIAAYGGSAEAWAELESQGFNPAHTRSVQLEILEEEHEKDRVDLLKFVDSELRAFEEMIGSQGLLPHYLPQTASASSTWQICSQRGCIAKLSFKFDTQITEIANEIIDAMTIADINEYTREGWFVGVSAMLVDEWEGVDLEEVLDAMDAIITEGEQLDLQGVPEWRIVFIDELDDNPPSLQSKLPGFMPILMESGRVETLLELYNAASEDTTWEWPGETLPARLEALFLLDETELDVVRMSLPGFLTHSFEAGLLTPAVINYWSPLLHPNLGHDYSEVAAGKLTVETFARRYGLRVMPRLPQMLNLQYYDCGCHAMNWLAQRYSKWDHGYPIAWAHAKPGDMVHYDGFHYGVVVEVDPLIVESCWGIDGVVFQHPLHTSPYRGPMIYSLIETVEK